MKSELLHLQRLVLYNNFTKFAKIGVSQTTLQKESNHCNTFNIATIALVAILLSSPFLSSEFSIDNIDSGQWVA